MKTAAISIAVLALASTAAFAADAKVGQAAYEKSCKGCHGPAGVAESTADPARTYREKE
jgi:mono/diheme cytochrome c family protein